MHQGLLYFNTKLKMLERRQQQVRELKVKHETLLEELEDTKARLMMDPSKWIGECKSKINLPKSNKCELLTTLLRLTHHFILGFSQLRWTRI